MFFKKQRVEEIEVPSGIWDDKIIDGIVYYWNHSKYYRRNGKWYSFYGDRALASWKLTEAGRVQTVITKSTTLGFRDGSLIQNAKDGRIYVISNAKRRLLTAPLGDYGFDYSQVVEVSDAEIQFHAEGEDI